MLCLVCRRAGLRDIEHLAYHVRDSHGKEARAAYKRGWWMMAGSGPQKSLFDAIDAPLSENGGEEIAGQKEAASIPQGDEPYQPPPTKGVEVAPVRDIVPPVTEQQPQPSFIDPKADLVVGVTGSGKTTNIGEVSDYVLAKYGKLTRMASTDPSGAGPLIGLVKAGQVEFWAVHAWPKPIEAMYKSCLGYWPLRVDDPESPLVEPDAGTFEVYGFGAFEGLTSYGDTILADLKKNKASLSQDPSYTWKQGDFETSGGNQSYYGMMQDTLNQWVIKTHLLRYEKILWTALESRGKDKDGNLVYGPMIGGKQATGKAGQWFCNFFHMDIIAGTASPDKSTGQQLIEAKHVLFLKAHIDPLTLIPFPCKTRPPKEFAREMPSYLESGSVAEAYRLLDTLYAKQEKGASAKLSEINGLKERLIERAGKARIAEAAAAEKRAKAANLLKPMVSVPAMPMPIKSPIGAATTVAGREVGSAGLPTSPAPSTAPKPAGGAVPVPVATVPTGIPTIQNVRRKP